MYNLFCDESADYILLRVRNALVDQLAQVIEQLPELVNVANSKSQMSNSRIGILRCGSSRTTVSPNGVRFSQVFHILSWNAENFVNDLAC